MNLNRPKEDVVLKIPRSEDILHFAIALSEGAHKAAVEFLGVV